MKRSVTRGLALVGVSAVAIAGAAGLVAQENSTQKLVPPQAVAIQDDGYADLVEAVLPAVVNVRVTGHTEPVQMHGRGMPFGDRDLQDFFERFFGQPMPDPNEENARPRPDPRQQVHGEGSGFFVDAEGHVVTNAHVVGQADEIEVVMQDGDVLPAKLVGIDAKTDLALLKIERGEPVPFVEWADSDAVRVGSRVVAVGNPFGLGGTVTSGIISATGRELGAGPYDDFLQIDASINRGNSGGPTFNLDGKVVGVNSMIFSPSGGSVGIGFAISANLAKEVIADLMDDGRIERGWLGVSIQPLDEDLAQAFGRDTTDGVVVANVLPDSPAEAAGLEAGDVILAIDGHTMGKVRDVTRQV